MRVAYPLRCRRRRCDLDRVLACASRAATTPTSMHHNCGISGRCSALLGPRPGPAGQQHRQPRDGRIRYEGAGRGRAGTTALRAPRHGYRRRPGLCCRYELPTAPLPLLHARPDAVSGRYRVARGLFSGRPVQQQCAGGSAARPAPDTPDGRGLRRALPCPARSARGGLRGPTPPRPADDGVDTRPAPAPVYAVPRRARRAAGDPVRRGPIPICWSGCGHAVAKPLDCPRQPALRPGAAVGHCGLRALVTLRPGASSWATPVLLEPGGVDNYSHCQSRSSGAWPGACG